MRVQDYNRQAWDRLVDKKDRWTQAVGAEEVARARRGELSLVLTPHRVVPKQWYPPLAGLKTLCLASGGGQQAPLLAAAGAEVVVFDNSPKQLAQDRLVAEREGLSLRTCEGDMADLSCFDDASFDFIFHPCSNTFSQVVRPVWQEAYRVLRPGGTMVAGFCNPLIFLFDPEKEKEGCLQLKYSAPFSDLTSLSEAERQRYFDDQPLSFGHTLEDQIGGQTDAGFHIIGFYEDDWRGEQAIDRYIKGFVATRSLKPRK